jgi:hypothetical protein
MRPTPALATDGVVLRAEKHGRILVPSVLLICVTSLPNFVHAESEGPASEKDEFTAPNNTRVRQGEGCSALGVLSVEDVKECAVHSSVRMKSSKQLCIIARKYV